MIIFNYIKELIMFPIYWFWKYYRICEKKNEVGKMIFLFLFSLTGVAVLAVLLLFIVGYLIDWGAAHPLWVTLIGAVIWLYIRGKEKEQKEATEQQELIERELSELEMQAEQGYASMLNVMYQTIRAGAVDVGGVTPTFMGEIEMPDGRFRLRDNICFYTFMLEKQDTQCVYDEGILEEFKNTLQFKLHNKLQTGAFPAIKIIDYRDAYGGMDGIVVHTIEDYGRYLAIYSVYASVEYSEYKHQRDLLKTQRSMGTKELTESWDEKK